MFLLSHHSPTYGRFQQTASIEFSYLALVSVLAFRLLPYGRSDMRRSIGESLPDDALQRPLSALYIVNAKSNAIAVAEIELGQISVQMLLFAMLIDALHATLEDRIIAFNGVGVGATANVFFLAVVDSFV